MGKTIKDFNRLIPEQRIAVLGDKEIDVTKIPSRVSLQLAEYADEVADGKLSPKEQFLKAVDVVVSVCKVSAPEVTTDWLLDNTDFAQLMQFTRFVLAPIQGAAERQEPGKKQE